MNTPPRRDVRANFSSVTRAVEFRALNETVHGGGVEPRLDPALICQDLIGAKWPSALRPPPIGPLPLERQASTLDHLNLFVPLCTLYFIQDHWDF